MSKKLLVGVAMISAAIAATGSQAVQFGKPVQTPVVVTKAGANGAKKQVTVMTVKLSSKEQDMLLNSHLKKYAQLKSIKDDLPSAINLGMNNVPVLDQGWHGTCVTFASTAAIDAVLGKGDYVSQLCNLEVGSTLETLGYMPSGWDGSFGTWVMDQMLRFGVVSKDVQTNQGCAGLKEYPTNDWNSEGTPMSLNEFNKSSEDISNSLYSVTYMNFFSRFDAKFADSGNAYNALMKVKQALANGHRALIGTFLLLSPYCSAGACATHNSPQDTWAQTSELNMPPFETGGHEMVIYGYDDDAVATDAAGNQYKGLLMLRNSWGDTVGDQGNYYMTYDYFIRFVGEVQEIVPIAQS